MCCSIKPEKNDVDKYDPWVGILATTSFTLHYTHDLIKGKSPGQLIFSQGMVLQVNHIEYWKVIRHKNWTHIN